MQLLLRRNQNILELMNNLKERKPFKVIYDGEDYGIYHYNPDKDRYEGCIGHIPMKEMAKIIKDKDHFIKLEIPK